MNIGFAIEIDIEADEKSALVQRFSDLLSDEFKDKSYGEDIENVYIGFICLRTVPGFESFSATRKPKYIAIQQVQLLDGSTKEIKNTFTFDIKLDSESYDVFVKAEDSEAIKLLKSKLLESLSSFDSLPKKMKKFDVDLFKSDITNFLKQQSPHSGLCCFWPRLPARYPWTPRPVAQQDTHWPWSCVY
jgi:hypothetical protein